MSIAPPPPTCIRRPDSLWTSCRCNDCRAYMARMSKRHRSGLIERADSDEAWIILDRLIARRWSPRAIASATGTNFSRWHGTLREHARTGRKRPLHHSTCVALATMGDPSDGMVGITGSRRRLQGLARQGYDLRVVSDATGIGFSTLGMIRGRATGELVRASFYVTIRDFAESVGVTIGPSRLAMLHAQSAGWPSLLAWDDLDDPAEKAPATRLHVARDDVDPVVVDRLLAGQNVESTRAEKDEAMRRWRAMGRSERSLCALHGWKDARYGREDAA